MESESHFPIQISLCHMSHIDIATIKIQYSTIYVILHLHYMWADFNAGRQCGGRRY